MPTLDEVREKIRRNFPKNQSDGRSPAEAPPLRWVQETMVTWVTTDNNLRVSKVRGEDNTVGYYAWTCAYLNAPARKIAGPFAKLKEAQGAAEAYWTGEPVQANL